MYDTMWKKLNLSCFSKFKCLAAAALPPAPNDEDDEIMPSISMSNKSVTSATTTSSLFSSSDDHERPSDSPPDMATVMASRRFFFSSPGSSNSIVDSGPAAPPPLLDGSVAVPTYSPDPYTDFRRSMQEMIDAREGVSRDWDYLHELLLCYLTLNHKNTHRIIVRAFSDLLVTLLSSPPSLSNLNLRTSASLEYKTNGNMDVL